jgi:hypothetical protein
MRVGRIDHFGSFSLIQTIVVHGTLIATNFPPKQKKNLFSRFSRIFLLGQFFCNSISICVSVLRWSPSRGKLRLINDNLSVDLDDNELLKIAQWFDLISSVKGSRIESFGSFLFGIP